MDREMQLLELQEDVVKMRLDLIHVYKSFTQRAKRIEERIEELTVKVREEDLEQ